MDQEISKLEEALRNRMIDIMLEALEKAGVHLSETDKDRLGTDLHTALLGRIRL